MSNNDQIILDSVLEQQRQQLAPEISQAEFFEVFAAEQALKDYDLSYEEIRSGIVDGGADGGIDGIYVIANGELVHEDSDLSQLKKGIQLDLLIVQATTSAGFSESRLEKLTASTEDLFDLSKPLEDFKTVYNEAVLREAGIFRDTQQSLASRFPQLRVTYFLASRATEVHPNVQKKADRLKEAVSKLFSDATADVTFLGSSELLKLARRTPSRTFSLQIASAISSGRNGASFAKRMKTSKRRVGNASAMRRMCSTSRSLILPPLSSHAPMMISVGRRLERAKSRRSQFHTPAGRRRPSASSRRVYSVAINVTDVDRSLLKQQRHWNSSLCILLDPEMAVVMRQHLALQLAHLELQFTEINWAAMNQATLACEGVVIVSHGSAHDL